MKRYALLLAVCLLTFVGCGEAPAPAADNAAVFAASNTVEAQVEGMTCGNCEAAVCGAVQDVPGVAAVKADASAGTMTVALDEGADAQAVQAAITAAVPERFTVGEIVLHEAQAPSAETAETATPDQAPEEAPVDNAS